MPAASSASSSGVVEVQAGRRRGHRSARAREDRLIALAVVRRVRRDGCTAAAARGRARRPPRRDSARRRPRSATSRRPKNSRSSTVPRSTTPGARAGSSNTMRAPGFSFCPGCTSACQCVSSTRSSSRHSTAPPDGSRRPISRAGNTRVSLATSRSPALSSCGSAAIVVSRQDRLARSTTSSRDVAARPRLLRDQRFGQLEVEVGDEHAGRACPR